MGSDIGIGEVPMLSAWEGISHVNSTVNNVMQASTNCHSELLASRRRIEELEAKVEVKAETRFKELENRFIQVETLAKLLFAENQKLSAAVKVKTPSAPPFAFGSTTGLMHTSYDSDQKAQALEDHVKTLESHIMQSETKLAMNSGMSDDPG